ncbi:MAG: hypothetical protein OEW83_03385 [Acidimicrobiia bacterium]|nr:hypothetical protein [Acidimicrobiia bacterium]
MRRWAPHLATAAFVLVVMWPLLESPNFQSVPLSHYPMYARDAGRVVSLPTVIQTSDGEPVSMSVLDTDDPLVAVTRLRRTIEVGGATLLEFCVGIADRLDGAGVLIATERHDAIAHLEGRVSLIDRRVHVQCGDSGP